MLKMVNLSATSDALPKGRVLGAVVTQLDLPSSPNTPAFQVASAISTFGVL